MSRAGHNMGVVLGGLLPKGSGTTQDYVWVGTLIWAFRRIALAGKNVCGGSQVTRLNFWIVTGADDHSERVQKSSERWVRWCPLY